MSPPVLVGSLLWPICDESVHPVPICIFDKWALAEWWGRWPLWQKVSLRIESPKPRFTPLSNWIIIGIQYPASSFGDMFLCPLHTKYLILSSFTLSFLVIYFLFFQADLLSRTVVTGLQTQGSHSEDAWVTRYAVWTSLDCETFSPLIDTEGESAVRAVVHDAMHE